MTFANALFTLPAALWSDEHGFIVSAELVLVGTVAVLALVVGLSEVSNNVNQELEDVGSAFACLDQSFFSSCIEGCKAGKKGSNFQDCADYCGGEWDVN